MVCDAKLTIRNIIARWPGSVHDSTILNDSLLRADLTAGNFGTDYLLGVCIEAQEIVMTEDLAF